MINELDRQNSNKTSNGIEKAYNYAVYLLGLKLRTEGELGEKMRLKKYNAQAIHDVIKLLAANKYVDDQRYAEIYLDNLKKYKSFGFYGIKKKLMEKRLPSEIIESVLAKGLSVGEEIKIAKRFLRKHLLEDDPLARRSSSSLDKQKTAQKLKSRGFRGEVVARLLF